MILPAILKKAFACIQAVTTDTDRKHWEFFFQTIHQSFCTVPFAVLFFYVPFFILYEFCQDTHLDLFMQDKLCFNT